MIWVVSFSSSFWGFVDIMFIELRKCYGLWSVFSQSSLIIGNDDFGVNDKRVQNFYNYLSENMEGEDYD